MSNNLNPMFSKPVTKRTRSNTKLDKVVRKKRCDSKRDIKVRVSSIEKSELKMRALSVSPSITSYTSSLVEEGLSRGYINFLPERDYPNERLFVHVKLSKVQYDKLIILAAEWDCSIRRAAHRILISLLLEKQGSVA
jgi:hypothetical protein